MEDLNERINQVLSDPESMKQLTQLASMLGTESGIHNENDTTHEPPQNPAPQSSQPDSSVLSNLGALANLSNLSNPSPTGGNQMEMLMRLAPMLGSLSKEDDTTRLLGAIRPFLSDERKKKLDDASKLLRMMKLLPMLREFKLFDF